MAELKGSKTEANLQTAFAGESMARNKYTYFASKAKKDGYRPDREDLRGDREQREGARQDLVQAAQRRHRRHGRANLKAAAAGENVRVDRYVRDLRRRKRARKASTDIAFLFEQVGEIEKEHEARYLKLLSNVQDKIVFSREGDCIWQCSNCGHIVVGKQAPEVCPVCNHPQAYFELKAENY